MIFTLVTAQERRLPLYVVGIGVQANQEPIRRPDGFPVHQVTHVRKGCGVLRIDGRSHLLPEGTVFCFEPGLPHEYHAVEEPWETAWVTFEGPYAASVASVLGIAPYAVFPAGSRSELPLLHRDIERELERDGPGSILETSALLYRMLVVLQREMRSESATSDHPRDARLEPVLAYMEEHCHEPLTLEALSALLPVTPYHLCRLFRRAFSLTPVQYLIRLRLQKAKQLLVAEPSLKVSSVARQVGYQDTSHFCALFKTHEKTTPQTFRRIHGVG